MHKSSKLHISYFLRWRLLIFYAKCSWDTAATGSAFLCHFHFPAIAIRRKLFSPPLTKERWDERENATTCLGFSFAIFYAPYFERSCVTCKFPQSDSPLHSEALDWAHVSPGSPCSPASLALRLPRTPAPAGYVLGLTVRQSAHLAWLFI